MSRTKPFDSAILGLTLGLCFATKAMAGPINLGEEEYSTEDRSIMAAIIEHRVGVQSQEIAVNIASVPSQREPEECSRETDPGGQRLSLGLRSFLSNALLPEIGSKSAGPFRCGSGRLRRAVSFRFDHELPVLAKGEQHEG